MSDQPDQGQDQGSSHRGEAVWRAEKERVAERNRQVKKAAKEQRQQYEQAQIAARREAELLRAAELRENTARD